VYEDIDVLYFKEVCYMANVCEICAKGEVAGMNVSHSHLKTKRTWKPNIQRVRAVVNGDVKRVNVCTRCLRSGKVERAI
jgi:large subunit ribosomal protein L28